MTIWLIRLAEILQLLSTFPIIVDILGPKRVLDFIKGIESRIQLRVKKNDQFIYKVNKIRPLIKEKLAIERQMNPHNTIKNIAWLAKEKALLDKEIESYNLGKYGKFIVNFTSLIETLLGIVLTIITCFSIYAFEERLGLLNLESNWSILIFFTLLIPVVILAELLTLTMLTKLYRMILITINYLLINLFSKFCKYVLRDEINRAFSRISYLLFIIGFIIKFVLL